MTILIDKDQWPVGRFFGRILRYGVVGIVISVIYSLSVVALVDGLDFANPTAASVVVFILVLPLAYTAHRRVTFFDAAPHMTAPLRFGVTTATSFIITTGGMYLVTVVFEQSYLYGIALNWVVIPTVNFLIYYLWVFRTGKSVPEMPTGRSSSGPPPAIAPGSPERFGYSWDIYGAILPDHEEQFRRWTKPIKPQDWQGARFLDAGCGIGRNAYWPMTYGAEGGVAIDVDERTLSRARVNLAAFPTVEVRHQSIYDIGDEEVFDFAFSIGVIHHLEFPGAAVERLVRATKPGGRVLIWLYGRENNGWIVRFLNPARILLLSRLPLGFVHALSWPLTAILWLVLRIGGGRLEYFYLIRRFAFRHLRAIVFDHLIPEIARYYTRDEAIALMRQAGLNAVEAVWVNEMSWTVCGRKPSR